MIRCQNCGKGSSYGSNFCRFCGIKFDHLPQSPPSAPQKQTAHKKPPPRPYSWKTDEFQVENNPLPRKTEPIDLRRPNGADQNSTSPINQSQQKNSSIQNQQPHDHNMMYGGYRCPRCGSQLFPQVKKKISSAGWIVFSLLLITFFPLCWIGFMIKEEIRICPVCGVELK